MSADPSHHLNLGNDGLRQVLGDLEAEIMECMWDQGPATVRTVHQCLQENRDIAYTTVMTVMTRLAEKGLLGRSQEGRAYIYSPAQSRDAFCTGVIRNVMDGLLGQKGGPVLAHFVDNLAEEDEGELDILAEIIERKRREAGR